MSTPIILDAGWMRELRILQGTQARAQSDVQAHITFSRSHWRHCPTWNRTENRSKINLENVKTKWEWSKSLRVDIWISTTEQICTSMFTYCTNTFGLAAPCKHYIYTNKLQSAILSLATTSSPLFICVQGSKNVTFHVNIFVYELLTVKSTILLKEALILKWYNPKRKLHSCYVELAYRVHRCLQISASFRSHGLDSKSSLQRCIPFYLDGIYWSCSRVRQFLPKRKKTAVFSTVFSVRKKQFSSSFFRWNSEETQKWSLNSVSLLNYIFFSIVIYLSAKISN